MLCFGRPVVQLAQCSGHDSDRRASMQARPFPTFQSPFTAPKFMLIGLEMLEGTLLLFAVSGHLWTCHPMDLSEPTKAVCPHNLLWQQVSEVHYLLCRQVLSHIRFKLIYYYFQSMSSPSNTVRFGDQQFHIQLIYHFHDFVNVDCISHTHPWPSPLQTEEEEILSALQDVICGICCKFNLLSCVSQQLTNARRNYL